MSTYFKAAVFKMTQVDLYEKGCQPSSLHDLGLIETIEGKTVEEVLRKIKAQYGKPRIFDGRLEFSQHEDDNGELITDREALFWKEGKINVWLADYSFHLSKVTEETLSHAELCETFPNLKKES